MTVQIQDSSDEMVSEINMTPFVDVMLVLLIIFLVTLPLVHQTVHIALPKVTSQKLVEPPVSIKISINQKGAFFLNQEPIVLDELQLKLQTEKKRHPESIVLLYVDQHARYEDIAKVLGTLHHAGISKVGFVTEDAAKDTS
jgi:biopolymer transport protein ExbD